MYSTQEACKPQLFTIQSIRKGKGPEKVEKTVKYILGKNFLHLHIVLHTKISALEQNQVSIRLPNSKGFCL